MESGPEFSAHFNLRTDWSRRHEAVPSCVGSWHADASNPKISDIGTLTRETHVGELEVEMGYDRAPNILEARENFRLASFNVENMELGSIVF